jgi:RNA polymerase sigma-70 factor (ECF subfamily)
MPESLSSNPDHEKQRKRVLLAMAGDESAFGAVAAGHQAHIRTFLLRMCGDRAMADDIAQETFVKAWRNLHRLRDAEAFSVWLRRIAVRTALDALRKVKGEVPLDEEGEPGTPLSYAETADTKLDVEAALLTLSPMARTCILLFHAEGMSHLEIAEETGMPVGTVKSHIARATARLRLQLAPWRSFDGR